MNLIEFQRMLADADQPVLVDFWAAWCTPCKMAQPILEDLAEDYAGRVRFLSVDADDSPEVVREYRVMGIPTLIAFQDAQPVARVTGLQSRADYEALFQALAQGEVIKPGVSASDRKIRLIASLLLVALGIVFHQWPFLILGALVGFWAVYDRCPVWAALTRWLRKQS